VVTGAISARAEVEVYPKQTGELVELLIDNGDKVKAGQTLARIESKMFEIQMKQAQADLVGAKANYEKTSSLAFIKSKTNFLQAKGNLDRLQAVLKQAEIDLQLQTKQADVQIKRATADLRIAEARLEAAVSGARTQDVEQAKVRKENAKRNLERLTELLKDEMVSQDQVESAQLQYDIYEAQLSLLEEGMREEDIEVLKAQVETAKTSLESIAATSLCDNVLHTVRCHWGYFDSFPDRYQRQHHRIYWGHHAGGNCSEQRHRFDRLHQPDEKRRHGYERSHFGRRTQTTSTYPDDNSDNGVRIITYVPRTRRRSGNASSHGANCRRRIDHRKFVYLILHSNSV